jgi:hypothetical protein
MSSDKQFVNLTNTKCLYPVEELKTYQAYKKFNYAHIIMLGFFYIL